MCFDTWTPRCGMITHRAAVHRREHTLLQGVRSYKFRLLYQPLYSFLGRPTYMSADLYFTTNSSSFFFLKPPFWTTSQLNGKFNGLYLRNKTWYRQSGKCVSKQHELWSTNGFKLDRHFYAPSVNSAFHFIAMIRKREISKRNSTTLCQTVDGKSR